METEKREGWAALPRRKEAGIAYYRGGEGAPVMLLHGVGLRLESWHRQIAALQPRCAVYAPDMPGHGESDLPRSAMTLDDYVAAVARLIQDTIAAPVILVGHSMGALTALAAACRFAPLCAGVVAMSAVYRRTAAAKQAAKQRAETLAKARRQNNSGDIARAPLTRWFGDKAHQDARALCGEWLSAANLSGYAAAYAVFANEDGESDENLAAMTAPTLFMTGDEDRHSTPTMAEAMAQKTPGGRAAIIRGGGHMAHMTHHRQVNDELLAFLESAANGGARA